VGVGKEAKENFVISVSIIQLLLKCELNMASEITSERGKILLLFENHKFYKKEALKSGEIKWCCTVRRCTAKLYTIGETEERIISRKFTDHNHQYKLYFDRTILTDIHIKHNRPDIIILNKQQKQAYLLDIAVPNSHNITQTYNTKINKYLELSVAMRNLWCLEKNSILPLVISATGIVPQSLFKNLKILDLDNTLVVEIQKGILLYSCHIVKKFLNIDTEHNTQQSQNAEARRR
jgi:hypothetical protein